MTILVTGACLRLSLGSDTILPLLLIKINLEFRESLLVLIDVEGFLIKIDEVV